MRKPRRTAGRLAAAAFVLSAAQAQAGELPEEGTLPLRFAGYVKSLYINSATADADALDYQVLINRLRLKADAGEGSSISAHVEYDVELRLGDYVNTPEFNTSRTLVKSQYKLGWDSKWASGSDYYASRRLYRGYVRAVGGNFDMILGRQRIALGGGRFWSGLDSLNPDNPVRVEQDERIGVDALKLEYKAENLARFGYILAPDPLNRGTRQIGQVTTNVDGTDVTLTGGMVRKDRVWGMDFATQVLGAGLRGEWVYTQPDIGQNYRKALFGVEYGFVNGLTLAAEIFRSSQRPDDVAATIVRLPQLPLLQPTGRRYLGALATYEPDPVYKFNITWLKNQEDNSAFTSLSFVYSFTEDASVAIGRQEFQGASTSEYGRGKPLFFFYYQLYF